jgi:hypothetical protein
MTTALVPYPWRQLRLQRGWEPVQLIGRMRIAASRDGMALPKTWLLIRLVFLWENHRTPVPGYYARLLDRVFDNSSTRIPVKAG